MNLAKCFRIEDDRFKLADIDPADTCGLDIEKQTAKDLIADGAKRLAALQEKLYAERRWAVLILLQGMDAAGKDGVIKHVMSGINPRGCEVHSFTQPTPAEFDHDFLWPAAMRLPARGRIGIFNRSYYEEVLVTRVRPGLLQAQRLPPALVTKKIWHQRYQSIRAFEQHLLRNGMVVLKFHLRISKAEQCRRLLARIEDPAKRWKFSMSDVEDHRLWPKFMAAYEDMIRNTATPKAPWYVVPADHKWFAWLTVAAVISDALELLDLKFPAVRGKALAELKKVRRALARQK
jgi:PPK2 family polyphosphate:nucleotide phosphotransferase